jgi:hypothetical protein
VSSGGFSQIITDFQVLDNIDDGTFAALTICIGKERPTEFSGKEAILIGLSRIA